MKKHHTVVTKNWCWSEVGHSQKLDKNQIEVTIDLLV